LQRQEGTLALSFQTQTGYGILFRQVQFLTQTLQHGLGIFRLLLSNMYVTSLNTVLLCEGQAGLLEQQ